ncbi:MULTISPECIES: hypothetical protein [Streptomyces]|uniref:Uncharacterized protein n=1 Tax=Streptomyces misionensis TaxID=67331 RepID=A0A1H5DIW8_9ACTN|nr:MULTISPECIES: hypothetical protein [Streptomyces]SED78814.1 hypothetical protein SAMN04490357_5835 [Streptomyces misionensis]SFY48781.1 hypothetical protein STEPF1_02007 [Streptomyces sp. F-1]
MLDTRRVAATFTAAFALGIVLAGSASAAPALNGQRGAATGEVPWTLTTTVSAAADTGAGSEEPTTNSEVPWT